MIENARCMTEPILFYALDHAQHGRWRVESLIDLSVRLATPQRLDSVA